MDMCVLVIYDIHICKIILKYVCNIYMCVYVHILCMCAYMYY